MNLKLSLRIDAPDDSDSIPNIEIFENVKFSRVLENELEKIYPASKNYENIEISLSFVSSDEIRELNKNYRNVDEATDVLSFPLIDDEAVTIPELPLLSLGDIIICPEQVSILHPELDKDEAILLMIAHSFLHLLGYDHDTEEKQELMWEKQEEIKDRMIEAVRS